MRMPPPSAASEGKNDAGITPGPLEGRIQTIAPKLIAGWAVDLNHPETPVTLNIWVEDRLLWLGIHKIATVLADGGGSGIARQFICIPVRPIPLAFLPTVRVCRASDGAELERSTGLDRRAFAWRHKILPPGAKRL